MVLLIAGKALAFSAGRISEGSMIIWQLWNYGSVNREGTVGCLWAGRRENIMPGIA